MKRSWTALAVTLFGFGMIAGCNSYNNSVQYSTGATITALSPSGLPAGPPANGVPVNPPCPTAPTTVQPPYFCLAVVSVISNPFPNGTVVEWNGGKITSTLQDALTVFAQVPYSLIAKPGTAYVNTYAPQSGTGMNGLSNALTFIIYGAPNPVPTLTSISPTTAPACGTNCTNASVPITISGSDFLPTSNNGGTVVTYTGKNANQVETSLVINSYSATQLKAVIPGAFLTVDDTVRIRVQNPPSAVCLLNCPDLGGGFNPASENQTFTVGNGAAAATSTAGTVAEETPAVSQDGRYVAFTSTQNDVAQIMLRDTCVGAANGCTPKTQIVSATSDGAVGNAESHSAAISAEGRYVAFSSAATNLVEGAPAGRQVYLRDTCVGAAASCKPGTTLISTDTQGALTGTESILPSISSSGRFVAFLAVTRSRDAKAPSGASAAAVAASPNSGLRQVFVRDTCLGATGCTPTTTRISLQPGDAPANNAKPTGPALSGLAKQIALAEGKSSTVFTPTVPIDDKIFLAIPNETK